jgi:hypothetical protein
MSTVTLKMLDLLENKEIERTIDISNVMVNNSKAPLNFEHDILGTKEQQRERLNNWIDERGNKQHDTILELISWAFN